MNPIRKKKIEREIQRTISELIVSGKVKDPRVFMATIHRVELSDDLSWATVYYTAMCSNNERKKLIAGLVSASSFLQSAIGKKLRLRKTPKLRFVWDNAYMKSLEVNDLIDKLSPMDAEENLEIGSKEEPNGEDDKNFNEDE